MDGYYGYNGKILRVDLTTRETSIEDLDERTARKYLGGTGLGAKILYEEVPPGVEWSDPENRVIIASGPLGGTRVMGSATVTLVTKGAITGGPTATQANGYMGAFLRFAGFDAVIVQGKAEKLSYLYVHDGQAEIRDATFLAGKSTWDTEDLVKKELGMGQNAMSVFAIGPAGENLVRFAGFIGDRGHSASHNGTGAVLGSKNLKAIAIARGSGRVPVKDEARLSDLSAQNFEAMKNSPMAVQVEYGTLGIMRNAAVSGGAPFRNYAFNTSPMTAEQLETFTPEYLRANLKLVQHHPCWACRMHHCDLITIPEGPLAGQTGEEPEYEGFTGMGTQIGNYNGIAATALANEVDRLGLDVNESGWVMGMAIECYEKGLITKKDTDGLELTWGNIEPVRAMLNKIARREGFGDILAEGVMRAARRIGGEAPDFAIHGSRGGVPVGLDHRRNWIMQLDATTSDIGNSEYHLAPSAAALGLPAISSPYAHQEMAARLARTRGVTPAIDCLGICRMVNRDNTVIITQQIAASTGWNVTWDEIAEVGTRAVNLLRAFSIRHGYTTDEETPSQRYASAPVDGPFQGRSFMAVRDEMVDIYYRDMGWDPRTGKPLPETLKQLGLDNVVPDLWES
jgi:aldehyde:ferredoxin oxidoreductase